MSATCSGRCDMMLQNHPINWVVPWLFPAALYVATRPSVGLSKIPCTTGTWPWNIFHLHQVISHQKWTVWLKVADPPIRKADQPVCESLHTPPHLGMKIKFAGKMPPRHQKCHPQRRPTASAFATMASKRGFKASCGSVGSFPCAWGKASKITSWISWYKQWKIPIYIFLSWCSHQKPPWLLMTPW